MFSVIIPTYNRLNLLKRAVNSVLYQSFKDFEIIIVDDCSTDGTWEWLKSIKDKKIRVYRNEKNKGLSYNRNLGASKSKQEYLAFLDDDDWWEEEHLKTFKLLFQKHKNIKAAFSGYIKTNEKKQQKAIFSNINTKNTFIILNDFFSANFNDVMLPSCFCIEKKKFQELKGFNTKLKHNNLGEDTEFFTKLAIKERIGFTNKYTVMYSFISYERHFPNNLQLHDIFDMNQFINYEKQNPTLKKWMDLNRLSYARQLKLIKRNKEAKILLKEVSIRNVSILKYYSFYMPYKAFKLSNDMYFKFL